MTMRSQFRVALLSFTGFSFLFMCHCPAQERVEPQSSDELRREVAELRAAVAELTKRLEAFEYQAIPRAEIKKPQLAEPSSTPSYVLPLAQPARFPVEVQHGPPQVLSVPKQPLPHYLRFPEQIERAMMGDL
jgi:hypothetical protein